MSEDKVLGFVTHLFEQTGVMNLLESSFMEKLLTYPVVKSATQTFVEPNGLGSYLSFWFTAMVTLFYMGLSFLKYLRVRKVGQSPPQEKRFSYVKIAIYIIITTALAYAGLIIGQLSPELSIALAMSIMALLLIVKWRLNRKATTENSTKKEEVIMSEAEESEIIEEQQPTIIEDQKIDKTESSEPHLAWEDTTIRVRGSELSELVDEIADDMTEEQVNSSMKILPDGSSIRPAKNSDVFAYFETVINEVQGRGLLVKWLQIIATHKRYKKKFAANKLKALYDKYHAQ